MARLPADPLSDLTVQEAIGRTDVTPPSYLCGAGVQVIFAHDQIPRSKASLVLRKRVAGLIAACELGRRKRAVASAP